MSSVLQAVKKLLRIGFSSALVIFILLFAIFIVAQGPGSGSVIKNTEGFQNILPFSVNNQSITYKSSDASGSTAAKDVPEGMSSEEREIVINRAKAMAEVKWTPQYDLPEEYCNFVFKKGTTYTGIPYSMGMYQAKNPEDFLNKISGSKVLYGNDCSGYVSAAWGLSRQTTLFFYNAVKNGTDIDGRFVCELPWEELKPADAILIQDGRGKGHIMLFLEYDRQNSDNIIVYEQNVVSSKPYEPIPTARKDVRSKTDLIKAGYFPIRLLPAR